MKHLVIFIFTLLCIHTNSQNLLLKPTKIQTPEILKELLADSIQDTYTIDFNGDLKQDYLVVIKTGANDEPITREYWYNTDFSLYRKVDLIIQDYDYKFFVNLDNDSIPEIIRAQGYSDGIDYFITKQDLINKSEQTIFYFNPIIERTRKDKDYYYWGHPWRLDSICLQKNFSTVKIKCCLDHKIERECEIYYPNNQTVFPAIVFYGDPKSNYEYTEFLNTIEWETLENIKKKITGYNTLE